MLRPAKPWSRASLSSKAKNGAGSMPTGGASTSSGSAEARTRRKQWEECILELRRGRFERLRECVRARDVALQPAVLATSASNQLSGTVLRVLERDGAYAAVELALRPAAAVTA